MTMTPERHDEIVRPEIERAAAMEFPPGLLYRSALADIAVNSAATEEEKERRRKFWLTTIREVYKLPEFDGADS